MVNIAVTFILSLLLLSPSILETVERGLEVMSYTERAHIVRGLSGKTVEWADEGSMEGCGGYLPHIETVVLNKKCQEDSWLIARSLLHEAQHALDCSNGLPLRTQESEQRAMWWELRFLLARIYESVWAERWLLSYYFGYWVTHGTQYTEPYYCT